VSCLLVAALAQPSQATPTEELQAARESFLPGDYKAAIGKFTALLYPTSRLAKASSIAEAHLLLGVSFFETGEREGASREFEEALFLDESLSLDADLFSAEAVRFFDEKKAELKGKAEDSAEKERLARREQALNRALQNMVVLEKRRYWVNFMPFGAGQFQNGERNKGFAFFVGEAVLGGTSVGLWSYQVIKYGFRGKVPRDEVDTVNTLQVMQIGSGALFYALMAWGIVDSLSHYEHAVKREADPSLLKDLEDVLDNEKDTTPTVIPNAGPDGAGVSLLWEF
jgi:tetratricopeptide (TPR) repeat protein